MFKKNDPYSFSKYCSLFNKSTPIGTCDKSTAIGTLFTRIQVTNYTEVQVKDKNSVIKNQNRKYLVRCEQIINIWNSDAKTLSPKSNLDSYENYPVLLNTFIKLENHAVQPLNKSLVSYSPQTVNTKIQSSGTLGSASGQTQGSSIQNSVGSSTAQTNSYGGSISGSITGMGDFISPSVSASANYEHSKTRTTDHSRTVGSSSSHSQSSDNSESSSMSMKDWGAYAMVNPATGSPTWTFGQEYPYDVIECRRTDGKYNPQNPQQFHIIISKAMSDRLFDKQTLYPASQLSMFGFNFKMTAMWLVTIDAADSSSITVQQFVNYFSGSHSLVKEGKDDNVYVYLDKTPTELCVSSDESLETVINLMLMALDPLGQGGQAAIVGFIPSKFIKLPSVSTQSSQPDPFEIVSAANNLLIEDTSSYPARSGPGAGFTASETFMAATFAPNCLSLQMTLYFKIVDLSSYSLYIKHWKADDSGITLTIVVNRDTDNPIVKHVDAVEAEGGENNLLVITLRNQDYASVDYHDYLQFGLNSIEVTIEPSNGKFSAGTGYQIRAISIEKN